MKQKFNYLLLILFILPCCFLFVGCNSVVYVESIEKTSDLGNSSVYTIYYSNGTTGSITVENGKDGEDYNLSELFEKGVDLGVYSNDADGFKAFLADLELNSNQLSINKAANKAMQSAVIVFANTTYKKVNQSTISIEDAQTNPSGGAGVIYKMDDEYSYIITNYHVVYSGTVNAYDQKIEICNNIYVYLYGTDIDVKSHNNGTYSFNGDAIECEYIGGSMNYDIAVLKVPTANLTSLNPHASAVEISNGYSLADEVFAIGNPECDGFRYTSGSISKDSEDLVMMAVDNSSYVSFRVLGTDTAVNGGNSGGGLFNSNGELVGIVNAKLVYSNSNDPISNMAYALPYDNVTKVADNIMYNYSLTNDSVGVRKVMIGISILTEPNTNSHQVYNPTTGEMTIVEDTIIETVTNSLVGSNIAYKMGLEAGDTIKSIIINNQEFALTRNYQLSEILLTAKIGDVLQFKYVRAGNAVAQNSGTHAVTAADFSAVK